MPNVKIVIGANFGDEGKGLMTDYFCSKSTNAIVVCANGGAQRGHTVVTPDGRRHVFHHLGAGTFTGADTYICQHFIINPMVFCQEYQDLFGSDEAAPPNIYINHNCLWTTPFDMIINQIIEEHRGADRHGSCGMGIWETILRNERGYSLSANVCGRGLKDSLRAIRDKYLPNRLHEEGIDKAPQKWREIIEDDNLIYNYMADCDMFMRRVKYACDDILCYYDDVVFENGQGLLLDQNINGYGEHTTPSNTGIKNAAEIIKTTLPSADVEACYVTRTYMTRHGAGRFDSECPVDEINPYIYDKTNIPNPHQGRLRYGTLNTHELRNRILKDFDNANRFRLSLAVTHLNEAGIAFASEDCFKNRYLSNGETRHDVFIPNENTV